MDRNMIYKYPFIQPRKLKKERKKEVPEAKEYAWDFEKHELLTKNGRFYFVYRNEAIKIWLWKLFQTPRFRYLVYNADYGEELRTLIGRGYTQGLVFSEAKRYVEEAIYYNLSDYVLEVRDLAIDFEDGNLMIEFWAITPYDDGMIRFREVIR